MSGEAKNNSIPGINERVNKLENYNQYYKTSDLDNTSDNYLSRLKDSYYDFQDKLEKAFGNPTKSEKGPEEYKCYKGYRWRIGDVEVSHYVFERFVLGEYVTIAEFRCEF